MILDDVTKFVLVGNGQGKEGVYGATLTFLCTGVDFRRVYIQTSTFKHFQDHRENWEGSMYVKFVSVGNHSNCCVQSTQLPYKIRSAPFGYADCSIRVLQCDKFYQNFIVDINLGVTALNFYYWY